MWVTRFISLTNFCVASSALGFQVLVLYPWHEQLSEDFDKLKREHLRVLDAVEKMETECKALHDAGLKVLRPGTQSYQARDTSYFSVSAQLGPHCIVQPRDTGEVSLAVKTLKQTECNWAVRGGGHMTWAGASNIDEGVTIDLGLMKDITYSADTKIARIGAGALWGDAYAALEEYGVTLPGGRTSSVGVVGFLLGGGNNFFSSNVGLGCDNVVNFEVVLGSGVVINANRDSYADLHKALKGGSSNFGIVTRVDMLTVDVVTLWGGQAVYPLNSTEQHIDAYVDWVDNIRDHPDGSAVTFWAYSPGNGISVAVAMHDTSDTERSSPWLLDTLRHDSHLNMTIELEEPLGYRQIWITITGKNDARFIRRAVEAQAQFVEGWEQSQDPDFYNYITFQAMPTLLFEHSVEKGGNVLGMDREKDDAVLFQMQQMVRTEEQEQEARKRMVSMREELVEYYNQQEIHVELMKDVAAKYDPEGVFQKRVPGGFKISNVN
ncbi:FAD binding domain-containing protein [Sarocladium implicatum]|nr:FAD binding domain-containing protein [Sarocladium implicatum]